MDTVKTCPACHKENSTKATICGYCGTPLISLLPAQTTEPISQQPPPVKHPDHLIQLTKLYANIVVFTVPGQEQPILVKGDGKIVLGRFSPGEIVPAVDLTPYNASLLGVSRQHAAITHPENIYLLQDLDSTNGTWLNDIKLIPNKSYPIQSGDLIRLGQLVLYVYFDTTPANQETIVELVLQKESAPGEKNQLTIQDLSNHVTPYLNALAQIQKLCDEILERDISITSIRSLEFDPDSAWINIKLFGPRDAVRLLKKKQPILQSLSVNSTQPPGLQSSISPDKPLSSAPLQNSNGGATTNSNGDSIDNREPSDQLKALTEFVNDLAPQSPDTIKKEYAEKLLPLLHILNASALDTINGR